jgi:predicted transcriptional regulator
MNDRLQTTHECMLRAEMVYSAWKKMVDQINKESGAALRAERNRAKVSMKTLSKQLGISAKLLSEIELGKRNGSDAIGKAINIL